MLSSWKYHSNPSTVDIGGQDEESKTDRFIVVS